MKQQKGFSLIELMIVVAIIGILAAVAIPAFLDYMHKAKTTEAKLQLNGIGKKAKAFWIENSEFPVGTTQPTPAKPGSGGCCGGPDNHCAAVKWTEQPWKDLHQEIDEPTLFYYQYTGTKSSLTATATGDLNCNGTEVTYTLEGTSLSGAPAVTLTLPATED